MMLAITQLKLQRYKNQQIKQIIQKVWHPWLLKKILEMIWLILVENTMMEYNMEHLDG